jgi:ferric-dicitrate binding protein FerR (iron transport regulator)
VTITEAANTLHTFSGKQYLRLPDGSKVILNKNSELSYGDSFGVISREVTLTGEAYFDIQHDVSRPFQVHTGKVMTTVRGTAFNVKAPLQENKIIVTVKRGKVDVGDDNHTYETLAPNEEIAVNTTTYSFVKTKLHSDVAFVWTSNFVILDEVGMDEAAAIISAHYNVNVALGNDQLKYCRITSTFLNNEKLWDVLDAISTAINATFTMKGDEVVIHGKGCSKH